MNIQRDAAELAKVSINVNESAWRTRGAVEEKKKGGTNAARRNPNSNRATASTMDSFPWG